MNKDIDNLKLRSSVLEYALNIEHGINEILALKLGISDKKQTKNFGNKAEISFQSKIDILFDIGILEKESYRNLELQMVFRNKFLHDLQFNSFLYAVENLDSGILNQLKKFYENHNSVFTEHDYDKAYHSLYMDNIKTMRELFEKVKEGISHRAKPFHELCEISITWINLYENFADEILKTCEGSDLEHENIRDLVEKISGICILHTKDLDKNKKLNKHKEFLGSFSKKDLGF